MSYQAPSGPKQSSVTVTNKDLLNSVPLEIDGVTAISGSIIGDSLYDGDIDLQFQMDNGSWQSSLFSLSTSALVKIFAGAFIGAGSGNLLFSSNVKFPYNIRILVTFKATQGSITVKFNTI